MAKRPKKPDLIRQAHELADEFRKAKPWLVVESDEPIRIRLPGVEEPFVCNVLGSERQEFGLVALSGPRAIATYEEHILGGTGWDVDAEAPMMLLTYERFDEVVDSYLVNARRSGLPYSRNSSVPLFVLGEPGQEARPAGRPELRIFMGLIRAVLLAQSRGVLRSLPWDHRRRMVELELGEGRPPELLDRVVRIEDAPARPDGPVLGLPGETEAPLRGLRPNGREWSAFVLPAPAVDDAPGPMILLLVREEETGLMMSPRILPANRADELANALLGLALDPGTPGLEPGRPARIHFNRPSHLAALRATLASFGIDADDRCDDSELDELLHKLEALGLGALRPAEAELQRGDWRILDQRLTQRLLEDPGVVDKAFEERPLKRYFVDADWGREVLGSEAGPMALAAYLDWFMMDYRAVDGPKRRSKTVAEAALAGRELDENERRLLEARSRAPIVPVRIVSIEVGASLEVESLLTGQRSVIGDRSLSKTAQEGLGLLLRLYEVDGETFASLAGPPIPPFRVMSLLDDIEAIGLELGEEAVVGDHAWLGEFWRLTAERPAPKMHNTDGDPIEWLTGVFGVAPGINVEAALASFGGIQEDGVGEWVWIVQQPGKRGFENGTVFARIQHIGDQLLVEVNSRRRLDLAEALLASVEGLKLLSVGATVAVEPGSPPPTEDDPEARAEFQAMLREHQMGWLDERVPALDGLTPRQAYVIPAMRPRVERMIRTMPDAGTPYGPIPAPREELLAELRR